MNLSNQQLEEFQKNISRDDFSAQVNTKFRVNENFDAELIEVSEIKTNPRQESFSLFFLIPKEFRIPQGNYLFEHSQLGRQELFVVPIEEDSNGVVFQAVFNRLLPKT